MRYAYALCVIDILKDSRHWLSEVAERPRYYS